MKSYFGAGFCYFIGLLVTACAIGSKTTSENGFLTIGLGLLTYALVVSMMTYLRRL